MAKKKYYTKCGREFKKSSTADVTGYVIIDFDGDNTECATCPFVIDVKVGYPEAVHKRYECRAGSEKPNHTNSYIGNIDDKSSINILSIDHAFLETVLQYCSQDDDLSAAYSASDNIDCRRIISVACSKNKKGIAAKKKMIDHFFVDYKETADNVSESKCIFPSQSEKRPVFDGPVYPGYYAEFNKADFDKLEFLYKAGKHLSDLAEIFTLHINEIVEKIEALDMEFICENPGCYNTGKYSDLTWIEEKDLYFCQDCMRTHFQQHTQAPESRASRKMFNQEFEALLKSVTTKTVVKNIDGQKMKEAAYKIIIETNDIDYESVEKEAPYIHGIITYNEIMQFKSVDFGEIAIRDLAMSIRGLDENGDLKSNPVDMSPAKIINLTVVNKVNIPHYFFSIEIPKTIPGRYLLDNLKGMIRVSLNKPAGLFDDIEDCKVTITEAKGEQEK